MPAISTPAQLRDALPRAYYAFFGRHARPRPIQLDSAGPLLEGRDALLMAPSASGKTEAACAPLCEGLAREGWAPPALVVVSPTRALANDLHRRLEGPLARMEIPLGRWTGERKEPRSGSEGSKTLPEVTITTPEALDSLISRGPTRLRGVRCVVLDELHILDGTPRGDQLRILLGRLRHITEGLQVVAVSATVAHPEAMAGRYLREAALVREARSHTIKARLVRGASPQAVAHHLEELSRHGIARKVLLFANRRDMVEEYAAELRTLDVLGGVVFAHHGSLSQTLREATEERFQAAPRALCVATMTLELGIDIGDVDLVGLLAPPPDVASLLQRIGRSGRRGAGPRAICFAADEATLFRYRTLLELAAEGDLAADPSVFHPSVLIQQSLSLLHQNPGRWVTAVALHRRLDPELALRWPPARISKVLDHLSATTDWLERGGEGRYLAGEEAERLWSLGRLHSNIADQGALEVVDGMTEQVIGSVAPWGAGASVRLGGRGRKVIRQSAERIVVGGAAVGEVARFAPRGVPILSHVLARAHARKLGVGQGRWLLIERSDGAALLFHFGGTAWGLVIGAALRQKSEPSVKPVLRAGPFAVTLASAALAQVPRLDVVTLRDLCIEQRKKLARALAMGPFHRDLPPEEADLALFEAADLEALAEELASAELVEPPAEVNPEIWLGLG
jgi:ATP-dependent Lhr-like helicase